MVKIENSDSAKDGGSQGTGPSGPAAPTGSSVPGIVVKEDATKIFTENIQTSGAYSAREESLKREVSVFLSLCISNFKALFVKLKFSRGKGMVLLIWKWLQEEAGSLKFVCLSNDGIDQHMVWYSIPLCQKHSFSILTNSNSTNLVKSLDFEFCLWFLRLIGLKNIFARQLPNMPKEYIVRLVMDR